MKKIVIVGGGVAGLTVALNLAPRRVCVITKSSLGINTSSSWAQGGIAAAVSKDDSNESQARTTGQRRSESEGQSECKAVDDGNENQTRNTTTRRKK